MRRCAMVKNVYGIELVKIEAAEAMRRKILVPALIDETKNPLEFRRLQAADLSQWQGEHSHPELEKFSRSIEENTIAWWNVGYSDSFFTRSMTSRGWFITSRISLSTSSPVSVSRSIRLFLASAITSGSLNALR